MLDVDDEAIFAVMAWVEPQYTKGQVNGAGRELLRDPRREEYDEIITYVAALDVVNNWRASHSFPLNTFQNGLRKKGRQVDRNCLVAQRIKRITSIRDKLSRFPTMTLSQMQDIGGCRAILSSVSSVHRLCDLYDKSSIKHKLHHIDDYITNPRVSGYRGVHMIYRYYSDKKPTYNSLLIEMQLRSKFQHAWATAVETVGAFVGQALKASHGHEDWLRFFALMGTVIALREKSQPVPGTPTDSGTLLGELRMHSRNLDVRNRLVGFRTALNVLEGHERKSDHYFLIVLNPTANTVSVKPFRLDQAQEATSEYLNAEKDLKDNPGADAVLVSVDSLTALRRAYPNYFADTSVFLDLLPDATRAAGRRRAG
jgi:hypothetical protein